MFKTLRSYKLIQQITIDHFYLFRIMENPWQVPSLDEYLFYCCPECDMKTKEYNMFYEHAVHRHDQAKILLVHDPDTKEDIKAEEEEFVQETDYDFHNFKDVKVLERKNILCLFTW